MMEANKQNYFETIRALANAEEEKDPYTRGHCERVMDHALGIGKALGLPEESLNALRYGAILHDIGKIGVPEQVLNKETPLDKEEFALIRQHPSMGLRILGDLTFMKDSIRIVHEHHERYDGHGYPSGLRDQEIDLLARIVCVADSFDAMTSKRPYRKTAMTQRKPFRSFGIKPARSLTRKSWKCSCPCWSRERFAGKRTSGNGLFKRSGKRSDRAGSRCSG